MLKRVIAIICISVAIVATMAIYVGHGHGEKEIKVSVVPVLPVPTATEEPIQLSTASPSPVPTPTATPIPTPTPSPSPVPFSYYAPTTQMSFEELVGDNGNYEMPKGYPKSDTYRIVVDKTFQVVMIYSRDPSGQYTVPVRYMLCSTGVNTPVGEFKMKRYRVRFGFFKNDKTFGQYWSLINGRIYFHSILYTERNNASSYIEEPYRLLGTPASHGCMRLTVPDARFIFYNAAYGTVVEIREGDPEDIETKNIREQLILAPMPEERITIDPLTLPNTDNWRIENVKLEVPYLEGSQKGQE